MRPDERVGQGLRAMRVLLVEDDLILGDGVQRGLTNRGHAVDWVQDGQSADTALSLEPYAVVILDLGLPKLSGLEVLGRLRKSGNRVPVLILSARDSISDRVKGLEMGADDYLVKPFDLNELSARLSALNRRALGRVEPLLTHGELRLLPDAHQVFLREKQIEMSPKEFALLQALLEQSGRVLSKEQLEGKLYGWGQEVDSNTIEVHIHHLRKRLGADLIRTIRGVGYMIPKPEFKPE